jgi:tetratricopeptide (TPR) repeat protein
MYRDTLGAALYRAGRFDDAAKQLTKASALPPSQQTAMAYTWFFLSMTHHRLGHTDEARRWLEKGIQATEEALKPPAEPAEKSTTAAGTIPPPWNRKLTLQLLRREAEEQIQGPRGKPGSNGAGQRRAAAPKKSDKK